VFLLVVLFPGASGDPILVVALVLLVLVVGSASSLSKPGKFLDDLEDANFRTPFQLLVLVPLVRSGKRGERNLRSEFTRTLRGENLLPFLFLFLFPIFSPFSLVILILEAEIRRRPVVQISDSGVEGVRQL